MHVTHDKPDIFIPVNGQKGNAVEESYRKRQTQRNDPPSTQPYQKGKENQKQPQSQKGPSSEDFEALKKEMEEVL